MNSRTCHITYGEEISTRERGNFSDRERTPRRARVDQGVIRDVGGEAGEDEIVGLLDEREGNQEPGEQREHGMRNALAQLVEVLETIIRPSTSSSSSALSPTNGDELRAPRPARSVVGCGHR